MIRKAPYIFIAAALLPACVDQPADDVASEPDTAAWETKSPTEELNSTHLWIVDRAVDLLGGQSSTAATRAAALMNRPTCRAAWQQGLFDADYKAPYHGGWSDLPVDASWVTIALSGADWAPHFYDPSTGVNYQGDASPTARTEALAHAANAKSRLAARDEAGGCYELGLALHFFTDITQPMHAANFTATDWPLQLHSHLEQRAMKVQAGAALTSATLHVGTPSSEIEDAAWTSYDQWPAMWDAIAAAYKRRCWTVYIYPSDSQGCWDGDARVDGTIRGSLRTAQVATAEFVASIGLPAL
ncbi:MAG: hypothetical protein H6709_03880 [Kofleriaceae bacterium]|nr:hypothetical protein [Myxococcales bacterium]MCB9560225.1 hypothetical protein [Kofleriaceae bacterium]MCB9571210.1 hypothetical protein [Kofleriaceae bacterium]